MATQVQPGQPRHPYRNKLWPYLILTAGGGAFLNGTSHHDTAEVVAGGGAIGLTLWLFSKTEKPATRTGSRASRRAGKR